MFTVKVFKVNKTIEPMHLVAMPHSHYCLCDCDCAQNGVFVLNECELTISGKIKPGLHVMFYTVFLTVLK